MAGMAVERRAESLRQSGRAAEMRRHVRAVARVRLLVWGPDGRGAAGSGGPARRRSGVEALTRYSWSEMVGPAQLVTVSGRDSASYRV